MRSAEPVKGRQGTVMAIIAIVVVLAALLAVWLVDRRINPGLVMALGLLVILLLGSRRRTTAGS